MVPGAIGETVDVLAEVKETGLPLYAFSNWSAETFPIMRRRFDFLDWFDAVFLSGDLGIAKPHPRFFLTILERSGLQAEQCLFIDDSLHNIDTARRLGFQAIRFHSAGELRRELVRMGILTSKKAIH